MKQTPEDEVLLAVARALVGFSTQAADDLGGVSIVQLRALTVLAELGTASLGELAEEIGVTVSTTSRLVDRLVAAGFVDRRTSPESRRQLALKLSRRGRSTLDRYDALRLAPLRDCLERVKPDRREEVLEALAEFGSAAHEVRHELAVAP